MTTKGLTNFKIYRRPQICTYIKPDDGFNLSTYQNVIASDNIDTNHLIIKDVTICFPPNNPFGGVDNTLNVTLPLVSFRIRGVKLKIVNKQRVNMKVFTASITDTINEYSGINSTNYIELIGLDNGYNETSIVSVVAFYVNDNLKGWQIV